MITNCDGNCRILGVLPILFVKKIVFIFYFPMRVCDSCIGNHVNLEIFLIIITLIECVMSSIQTFLVLISMHAHSFTNIV